MTKFATDFGLPAPLAIACGIGATTLFGGRGVVLGSLVGALIFGVFHNGLTLMGGISAAFARHVVIMDEPTAALGVKEGNMVLELIRRVRDKGLPVILISHNMPHVFEIADRIHIARLGKRAAVVNPQKISMSDAVAVMTGAKTVDELPADALA